MFENENARGVEFLRAVKRLARKRNLVCHWKASRGSGSHGTLYLGQCFTVVNDLQKDIGPGLLADMCRQLGIRKEDL